MASFSDKTFACDLYATFRPTYPSELYDTVFTYHNGSRDLAVDLGTGHGLVARRLARTFTEVIGSDASPGMIIQATKSSTDILNVSFREGRAESCPFLNRGEADLVTAAECAHWFDHTRFWPEMARVVRPGGTVAIWVYESHVLVDYPCASALMDHYIEAMQEDLLGPYWPQPGHSILKNQLRDVQVPESHWRDVQRLEYRPGCKGLNSGTGTRFLVARLTLGALAEYIRTFSAYHEWQRKWPERKRRPMGDEHSGRGDIVDEILDEIRKVEPKLVEKAAGGLLQDVEVDVEWQSAMILARRR